MTRLRRYIVNGLTVMSLLKAIATAGLWVRSYWRQDTIAIHADRYFGERVQFASDQGA